MEIACFICDKKGSVDEIVRHLKTHSDNDSITAYKRFKRKEKPEKSQEKPESLGGTYVDKKAKKE